MVCRRRDSRRRICARLVALALAGLCVGSAAGAQETGPDSHEQPGRETVAVSATVMPQRVQQGNRFSITIEIEPVDASLVEVEEPDYPAAIVSAGGAQVTSRASRTVGLRSTMVRVDLQAAQAGRWIVEPFTVSTPQLEYVTNPALVEISMRDDASLVPYDLEWRVHSDSIYEGQSVAVTLDMVNVTEFSFPDRMTVQPPSGALFEEAHGVGEIEAVRYGEIELFRVPVASYLLTPSAAGTLTLPAAEIHAFGLTRRAAARPLAVDPLPEGAGESAAVGRFSFSSNLSAAEIGLDESLELRMQVQGVGNLRFLQFPEVSAEGLVVSDSETGEDLLTGPDGYIGTRTQTVRLRPTGAGDYDITVASFAWYDPQHQNVRREGARTFPLRVVDRSEAAAAESRRLPPLLSAEQVRRVATLDLFRLPGTYLTAMPGLIMLTVVTYVRRRRRESIALFSAVLLLGAGMLIPAPDAGQMEQVAEHYRQGEYSEAYHASQQLLEKMPQHPGLLYNSGVTAFAADEHARSIFQLRRALVIRPLFRQARESLVMIEAELGLDRQYALQRSVHPDVPLIAALVLFYVLVVLLLIPPQRRRARYAISMIVTLFCLVGALSTFAYSHYVRREPVAVVGPQSADLKRIPEEGAQTWLTLDAGTSVRPLVSRGGHTLVSTGYGLDGWIRGDSLLQQE